MDLPELVRVVRAHWVTLLATALIGVIGGLGVSLTKPQLYQATAQVLVTTGNEPSAEAARAGIQFAQGQIASYALLIKSKENVTRALRSIGSNGNPTELVGRISTSFVPKSVILDVSLTDPDPRRAAILVNAIAEQFTDFAREVDTPAPQWVAPQPGPEAPALADGVTPTSVPNGELRPDTNRLPTRATVIRAAAAPTTPLSRNVKLFAGVGGVLGLMVGFGIAWGRERLAKPAAARQTGQDGQHGEANASIGE